MIGKKADLVSGNVPVTDEEGEVSVGGGVGDGDDGPGVNVEGAEASGGSVHESGGEVGVGADLVLGLELVGVGGVGRDGAVGSQHTVLPRILSLLYTIPEFEHNKYCLHKTHQKTEKFINSLTM